MEYIIILPPTMGKKNKTKLLNGTAILRDEFVPQHLNAINLAPVYDRWVLCAEGFNVDGSPSNMEPVIVMMAEVQMKMMHLWLL